MKVHELIRHLSKHGQDAEVMLVTDFDPSCNGYHELGAGSVTSDDWDGNQAVYIATEDA